MAMETDTLTINLDDDEPDENLYKPLLQLFKRMIKNDNKQNTVITNAQIVDILDKEFNINLWDIHELEGDIYLTIVKSNLKDWPQWDEFEKTINTLKIKNDKEALNRMLESNYHNLKDYLKVILDRAQTLAKSTINKLIEDKKIDAKSKRTNLDSKDDVVLEIQCSRQQLNRVIFRRPNPAMNDTIFNGAEAAPTQIKLNRLPLEAILNWWDVKISVQRGSTHFYERHTVHLLEHALVNKNLMRFNPLKVLPQELQIRRYVKSDAFDTSTFEYIAFVDVLKTEHPTLAPLFKFIQKDMRLLPEKVSSSSSYRRYTNKYPYVRYLYTEVKRPDVASRKYDLQLEETVSPMYRMFLGPAQLTGVSVVVECGACMVKFTGDSLVPELKAHFEERHADEPDFKCTNCDKIFPMAELAKNWWTHRC